MRKENPEKRGRKWFDGKDEAKVVSEIKYIWGIGGNDAEAASYADISKSSLGRYLEANPELLEIRERLQQMPFIYARETIIKSIKENPQSAFEYMKRKKRGEFGDNVDLTTKGKELPTPILNALFPDNSDKKDNQPQETD